MAGNCRPRPRRRPRSYARSRSIPLTSLRPRRRPGRALARPSSHRETDSSRSWTFAPDEGGDLLGRGEHHLGAVAAHAGADDHGLALARAMRGRVGLEAQVELPEGVAPAVAERDAVGVAAMANGAHPLAGIDRL